MRDLSRVERWVGLAAGVVTIVVGLVGFVKINPNSLQLDSGVAAAPAALATATTKASSPEQASSKEELRPAAVGPAPMSDEDASRARAPIAPAPVRRQASEFPVQALLRDGDQRVVLGGDLGVGVAFSEVASTPIATLQISREGIQETKALLTSGGVFTVAVRGEQYRISVTRLDFRAKELQIRIDRLR